jgi:hypothetical protein
MHPKGRFVAICAGFCFPVCGASVPGHAETTEPPQGTASTSTSTSKGGAEATPKEKSLVAIRVGYGTYGMAAFNRIERSQGNEQISAGASFAIEGPGRIRIPDPIPLVGNKEIPLPWGVEYLDASSRSTHSIGGNSATISWSLPALGLYIGPEIKLGSGGKDGETHKKIRWSLRPVAVGYYWIGELTNANLSISDRPGRLDVKSRAPGFKTEILAVRDVSENVSLLVSAGYRYLHFNDVVQESAGGFGVATGALRTDLDYSGAFGTVGVRVQF